MIKITPIIPRGKSKLNSADQLRAVWGGLDDAKDEALKDFEKTDATWEHQAGFEAKKQADGYLIGTKDKIWNMLDKGTKAHTIVASKRALRFRGGYKAKTRPAWIDSGAGGATGSVVFRKIVHHPGTKARNWSTLIGKRWRALLGTYVQKRISEAMR